MVHQNVIEERTENATLWGTKLKPSNRAIRTLEQNTRGSVMQVLPHPTEEVALISKVHELVENDILVGNIKGVLQVNENNDTLG